MTGLSLTPCPRSTDVVFFIFLYQRYIYRVDPSRVNEFGFSQEMLERKQTGAPAAVDQQTAEQPAVAAAPPKSTLPARKQIIPAGQPLPPQPSANEISPEALAKVNEVEKKAKKISLMELTERTCKWPVGDPATEDFWFCGLPVKQGKPYCEAHVGVAFQPMSSRRDRRR